MIERTLFESLWNTKDNIVSWKWWVWKSTVSAALSLYYSEQVWQTIAIDMDASHSLWDSLWCDIEKNKTWTFSKNFNENLVLYFLSKIIPYFDNDPKHDKLNYYLDSLFNIEGSFLPLLRLAIHPTFVGMPLPHENVAYALQLLELFERNTIYNIEDDKLVVNKLDSDFDRRIIDSENTQWLMRVINSILAIRQTLTNINQSFYWSTIQKTKRIKTKIWIASQDNLNKLAQSDLIKNYENYIWDILKFHLTMFNASLIIVTQPWYNDLNQTITDIWALKTMWIIPKHILVNKFRDHFNKDKNSTKKIYEMLLKSFPDDEIWITPIDSDFKMLNPFAPEKEKQETTKENLWNIAQTFK